MRRLFLLSALAIMLAQVGCLRRSNGGTLPAHAYTQSYVSTSSYHHHHYHSGRSCNSSHGSSHSSSHGHGGSHHH